MTERRQAEENARRLLQEEAARKAAEASAREAQEAREDERRHREQLRVTLSSIGDAVIVTDRDGIITFMNPVAVALTGWQPQEAAGQPLERVFRIFNDETREPVEHPVGKVLCEGTVVGLANHTILVTRDGRELPVDDSGAPIRGEGGAVAGVVLVFRDVSEARRAIEARLRLAAIAESSDDAIIGKDLDGNVTSWNQGAERLFGYAAAEFIGRPVALLVPPERPDELPSILARIRRGERVEHFETVRLRQDGSRVDVSLTASSVRNAEGKVIGASKIGRDITARKREEASLRFLAEASRLQGQLLDVPDTLQKVADLAVPQFADWCAAHMLEPDGSLRRMAVAHADPARIEQGNELSRRYPIRPTDPHGPAHVARTGHAEMASEVPDAIVEAAAQDDEYLRALRWLGFRSYISVPLAARGRTLGVLTFLYAESGRRFGPADLRLAEDLGHRAAIAVENARLYQTAQNALRQREESLALLDTL
jgi:PAS domain S-box-containing protein